MTTQDIAEFGRRLAMLAEVFDAKLSASRIASYFEALRDLAMEQFVGACQEAARTCTFFPRPAELRTLAVGNSEDVTEAAWVAFRAALPQLGYMASVIVEDAALGETILAMFGSWPQACSAELSPEMWTAKRKEFGRIYRVMRGRHLEGARYLPGIAEAHNQQRADWMRFVSGGRIARSGEIVRLNAGALEAQRPRLAAASHEFSRLESEAVVRLIPPALEQDA